LLANQSANYRGQGCRPEGGPRRRVTVKFAKTMDLKEIAKKIGRKPEAILKRAKRAGIKIKIG
jgi:hypothetical protein